MQEIDKGNKCDLHGDYDRTRISVKYFKVHTTGTTDVVLAFDPGLDELLTVTLESPWNELATYWNNKAILLKVRIPL